MLSKNHANWVFVALRCLSVSPPWAACNFTYLTANLLTILCLCSCCSTTFHPLERCSSCRCRCCCAPAHCRLALPDGLLGAGAGERAPPLPHLRQDQQAAGLHAAPHAGGPRQVRGVPLPLLPLAVQLPQRLLQPLHAGPQDGRARQDIQLQSQIEFIHLIPLRLTLISFLDRPPLGRLGSARVWYGCILAFGV